MHEAGNISDISNKLEMILKDPDEIRIRGESSKLC